MPRQQAAAAISTKPGHPSVRRHVIEQLSEHRSHQAPAGHRRQPDPREIAGFRAHFPARGSEHTAIETSLRSPQRNDHDRPARTHPSRISHLLAQSRHGGPMVGPQRPAGSDCRAPHQVRAGRITSPTSPGSSSEPARIVVTGQLNSSNAYQSRDRQPGQSLCQHRRAWASQ